MVPLTADLAPPESRSKAISITLSGLMLGVLVARVLSGIIAEFADWRYVYWMSVGLQYLIFIMLWWTLPDYPAKVADVGYWQVVSRRDRVPVSFANSTSRLFQLWSMATYLFKYPTLVQCCLIGFFSSGKFQRLYQDRRGLSNDISILAVFTNWWTTLTFLLSDPPYRYNTLEIGLFGLVGLFGVSIAPFTGKLLDNMEGWLGQFAALIIQVSILNLRLWAYYP